MRANGNPAVRGGANGFTNGDRVTGVIPARDVGGCDERKKLFVPGETVGAAAFAEVGVEVYRTGLLTCACDARRAARRGESPTPLNPLRIRRGRLLGAASL